MTTVVDSIYLDFQDIGALLSKAGEVSLQVTLDAHARKTLLLSAASYFEAQLTKTVREFTEEAAGGNSLLESLVQAKAISRQYHTWFDWERRNANKFFSLFGKEFKDHMAKRIEENEKLDLSIRAFMEIGGERNLLVHSDYASYPIEKTPDEVYELFKLAKIFVDSVGAELRACSNVNGQRGRNPVAVERRESGQNQGIEGFAVVAESAEHNPNAGNEAGQMG